MKNENSPVHKSTSISRFSIMHFPPFSITRYQDLSCFSSGCIATTLFRVRKIRNVVTNQKCKSQVFNKHLQKASECACNLPTSDLCTVKPGVNKLVTVTLFVLVYPIELRHSLLYIFFYLSMEKDQRLCWCNYR